MGKIKTEDCLKLTIFNLKKYKMLKDVNVSAINWTSSIGKKNEIAIFTVLGEDKKYIELIYTKTNKSRDEKNLKYQVPLVTTKCNYGGFRYWFVCPLIKNGVSCLKRVGALYKPPYEDHFGCRSCYELTYGSKMLNGFEKKLGRIISIPELEQMEKETKRTHYRGKTTRKYLRFLRAQKKSSLGLKFRVAKLYKSLLAIRPNTIK